VASVVGGTDGKTVVFGIYKRNGGVYTEVLLQFIPCHCTDGGRAHRRPMFVLAQAPDSWSEECTHDRPRGSLTRLRLVGFELRAELASRTPGRIELMPEH
jgi:hypothetical protein